MRYENRHQQEYEDSQKPFPHSNTSIDRPLPPPHGVLQGQTEQMMYDNVSISPAGRNVPPQPVIGPSRSAAQGYRGPDDEADFGNSRGC